MKQSVANRCTGLRLVKGYACQLAGYTWMAIDSKVIHWSKAPTYSTVFGQCLSMEQAEEMAWERASNTPWSIRESIVCMLTHMLYQDSWEA